jgi:hypothetical protein
MEVAGLVLGALPLLVASLEVLWQDQKDFGLVSAIALRFGLFDAKGVVDEVREHFIKGDGGLDQAMAFKDSYTPTFNMVGVAGAILAQIALTALGLPNLGDTHWTARASFVLGLVAGSLAVFCSCVLQSKMSALHNAHAVRSWLTRPRESYAEMRYFHSNRKPIPGQTPPGPIPLGPALENRKLNTTDLAAMKQELSRLNEMFNEKGYRPSLSAALILTAPSQLLNVALGSLLIGFGIYFGFVYSARLPAIQDNNSALAVLVVYVASASSGLFLFFFPFLIKLVATMRDRKRDGLEQKISKLESDLQEVQRLDLLSRHDDMMSALIRIVSLQDEQLKVQKDFQALLEARFHTTGSRPPSF